MDKETLSNYGWVVVVLIVLALMISLATPFGSMISSNIKGSTNKLMGVASDSLNNVTKYESFESMGSGESSGGMAPDAGPTVVDGANQEVNKGGASTLSFRSSASIETFQEVKVDGETVARENYDVTEGSTIITFKESYLNSLTPGDHTIDIVSTVGVATSSFTVINVIPENATYTQGSTTYNAGENFPETVKDGDLYVYGDYEYCYNRSWSFDMYEWGDPTVSAEGWGVRVLDQEQTEYGSILNSINGQPITCMNSTFAECYEMTSSPEIPESVVDLGWTFYNASITHAPVIPSKVVNMDSTFMGCSSLFDIYNVIIPASVTNMYNTFGSCTSMGGSLPIYANPTEYDACFEGVDFLAQDLRLSGTSTVLDELGATGINYEESKLQYGE